MHDSPDIYKKGILLGINDSLNRMREIETSISLLVMLGGETIIMAMMMIIIKMIMTLMIEVTLEEDGLFSFLVISIPYEIAYVMGYNAREIKEFPT